MTAAIKSALAEIKKRLEGTEHLALMHPRSDMAYLAKLIKAVEEADMVLAHLWRELNNGQALEPQGPNHGYIEQARAEILKTLKD